jgi:hypothetical protein
MRPRPRPRPPGHAAGPARRSAGRALSGALGAGQRHNPAKLASVEQLAEQHAGNQDALNAALRARYGADISAPQAPAPPRPAPPRPGAESSRPPDVEESSR